MNDILRQKRHAFAIGINDARGCYNRIVHSIVILVLISFRVLRQIARALFKILQEADHHMKTGFGRSSGAYWNKITPHQGSGQGNGMGIMLWTLIYTKLTMMILARKHDV